MQGFCEANSSWYLAEGMWEFTSRVRTPNKLQQGELRRLERNYDRPAIGHTCGSFLFRYLVTAKLPMYLCMWMKNVF